VKSLVVTTVVFCFFAYQEFSQTFLSINLDLTKIFLPIRFATLGCSLVNVKVKIVSIQK